MVGVLGSLPKQEEEEEEKEGEEDEEEKEEEEEKVVGKTRRNEILRGNEGMK